VEKKWPGAAEHFLLKNGVGLLLLEHSRLLTPAGNLMYSFTLAVASSCTLLMRHEPIKIWSLAAASVMK
jgi:hypothetical protein